MIRFFAMLSLLIAMALACLIAIIALAREVVGQTLPRGLGHPPGSDHWYDSGCCSLEDCEPVESGAIVETPEGYAVRYLTSRGFVADGFIKHSDSGAVRQSKDARQHACATNQRVICIYIHFGA